MSHPVRPSKEITSVHCATCEAVHGVEWVETHEATTTFCLTCGHTVTLQPGAVCKLDVQADAIILYPHWAELLVRQGATS
mgnify:CR=1 FL=1